MAITMPVTMTRATHNALQAYRDHLETLGYSFTLAEASGNLISEALQSNGFINNPEYIRGKEVIQIKHSLS